MSPKLLVRSVLVSGMLFTVGCGESECDRSNVPIEDYKTGELCSGSVEAALAISGTLQTTSGISEVIGGAYPVDLRGALESGQDIAIRPGDTFTVAVPAVNPADEEDDAKEVLMWLKGAESYLAASTAGVEVDRGILAIELTVGPDVCDDLCIQSANIRYYAAVLTESGAILRATTDVISLDCAAEYDAEECK